MMYEYDNRIVMTLDAGGTNFVFSAIQSNREVVEPIRLSPNANDINKCLNTLIDGFNRVKSKLSIPPVAISFAFPGPADYTHGIIGDLPNLPAFRGGIALGAFLEEKFNIPVFINNDGNLFAYGEALAGALPEVNTLLETSGSSKRFRNLLGITLGTGFGAGAVIENNRLLTGDNNCGGDIWIFRNKKYRDHIAEESVSIRAVKRVYKELTGDLRDLSPQEIFAIAEGTLDGDRNSAITSFTELGEIAGDAIAHAITIIDGIIVIGGGVAKAAKYIVPALVKELNSPISMFNGSTFGRLQMKAYNLDDPKDLKEFTSTPSQKITVPMSKRQVDYDSVKRIAIVTDKIGTSKAISLGAYAFALNKLDSEE